MKLDLIDTWTVRIDVVAPYPGGTGRTYKKHVNLLVLAKTAERAIELARRHYPESSVWAVNHAHKDAIIIFDDVASQPGSGADR